MHRSTAIWSLAGLALLLTGSVAGMGEHVSTPDPFPQQKIRPARMLQIAKSFHVIAPAAGDNWVIGDTATIHWHATGITGNLAGELFRNREKIRLFFRSRPVSDRAFTWKVTGDEIVPGTGYQVRLTTLSDRKSHTSGIFSISEPFSPDLLKKYAPATRTLTLRKRKTTEPVSLKLLSPTYNSRWELFEEVPVRWESTGLTTGDEIVVLLHKISTRGNIIIAKTANSGEYNYRVPYPHVFYGHDLKMKLIPLKKPDVEAASDPFAIMRPRADLVPGSPSVSYRIPRRRARKWWEVAGDIFTGGITWAANEAAELATFLKNGVTMEVRVQVIQKGAEILGDVAVDCNILEDGFNVAWAFPRQKIPFLKPDTPHEILFTAPTKPMGLRAGTYTLEIFLDPDNHQREDRRLRENNRVRVELKLR